MRRPQINVPGASCLHRHRPTFLLKLSLHLRTPLLESPETQLLGTSKYPQWNPRGVFCLLVKHHGASRTPRSRLFSKAAVLTELTRSRWLWTVSPASTEDPWPCKGGCSGISHFSQWQRKSLKEAMFQVPASGLPRGESFGWVQKWPSVVKTRPCRGGQENPGEAPISPKGPHGRVNTVWH